ncbi:hypothetical protein FisN_12Hh025 [Fistulifera solaris]|uniref:Uncharacterized protein n=1 Tax=Fistulifera solaris TaxID=1519565 RepID=A0A1Z5K1M2_FISSO|nr:hypothetical protein FisN_12Hh025 [Fistulifera solaris]|eukprot:GAX20180.1 hypothetical protein FisN_12Hh025 [Fistulifera solaris]
MNLMERSGVEEKKEDATEQPLLQHNQQSKSDEKDEEEQKSGLQAQMESYAQCIFGSCGEVASIFTGRRRNNRDIHDNNDGPPPPPPLSIADELRRLAAQNGQIWGGPRAQDIPRFLGEEAVHSFDDDNISQISQHTLEELMRNGDPVAHRRMLQQQHQQMTQQQQQEQKLP